MAIWDDVVPEKDRRWAELAGLGKEGGFGERPALIVVDVIWNFIGEDPDDDIETTLAKSRFACGPAGWDGLRNVKTLIEACREKQIPIFYTGAERRPDGFDQGGWNWKTSRNNEAVDVEGSRGNTIPDEIAPQATDLYIDKPKPSAFFHTQLINHLIYLGADTVIVTGATTSGCVRATAVDAASHNFHTVMPIECVWDRWETSHKVTLFDFHMKYGDVKPLSDVLTYVDGLPQRPCGPNTPTGVSNVVSTG